MTSSSGGPEQPAPAPQRSGRRHSSAPSSTYRLQITADFTLHDAAAVVDYLATLGVGAVYLSPLLTATRGSTHGYDVTDHRSVDPERGGEQGFLALAAAADAADLALVVDIVPNHMGVADAAQNRAWWTLLATGRHGPTGNWFDVDWGPDPENPNRIKLPVLGDDADLASDLQIVTTDDGRTELRYYEHRYPVAAGTYSPGDPVTAVHDRQHYELVNFRRADTEQNYRRFFAVTDLAGLRVEDPEVFTATHAEILRWASDYGVTGIRIDHPDGLRDPQQYLQRLREAAPGAWITVEKITEPGEELPPSWPVEGMTGYDALAEIDSVFLDPSSADRLSEIYEQVTGDGRDFSQHVADGKRHVATTILQAEVRRIVRLLEGRDGAPDTGTLIGAITELAVAFGVYRSYLPLGVAHLTEAASVAQKRRPDLGPAIDWLLPRLAEPGEESSWRFQQLTGAVMAKGVEDTAYYRYTRLISLNEVGNYPGRLGLSLEEFHAAQLRRADRAPEGMTTLSTHDTKRGEDIRARISAIDEMTDDWLALNGRLNQLVPVPNRAFGYLLWQTFVATGFIERDRMHAFAEKAMREASDGTRWIDPDETFETAVHAAVDTAYDNPDVRALLADFAGRIAPAGAANSLGAKLVQLTMPGVPDVYQGSELWEESLVDPDNRRPVDFDHRRQLLAALDEAGVPPRFDGSPAAKLWVTSKALRARRDRPELFTGYQPLRADGPASDHVLAFDRGGAVTVAVRLPAGLHRAGGWKDTALTLPPGEYVDVLAGRPFAGGVHLSILLETYPVALLLRNG